MTRREQIRTEPTTEPLEALNARAAHSHVPEALGHPVVADLYFSGAWSTLSELSAASRTIADARP